MPVLLVLLFILVPIVEIWAITQVAGWISWPWTIVLLIVDSILGSWLLRREGARAWQRFRETLGQARIPAVEVVDGALIIFGGALLLTPGFVTDIVGLACLIPPTRKLLNVLLRRTVLARLGLGAVKTVSGGGPRGPLPGASIDVEVVEVKPTQRPE